MFGKVLKVVLNILNRLEVVLNVLQGFKVFKKFLKSFKKGSKCFHWRWAGPKGATVIIVYNFQFSETALRIS